MKIKVYLDNVIDSATKLHDLAPQEEQEALGRFQPLKGMGILEIVTSRESWREQERTNNPEAREKLRGQRRNTPVVSDDHKLLGINTLEVRYGTCIASPLITDIVNEKIFTRLQALGLESADARHLMYALCNGCEWFVTMDEDFIDRRKDLQAAFPAIRIVKPTELLRKRWFFGIPLGALAWLVNPILRRRNRRRNGGV